MRLRKCAVPPDHLRSEISFSRTCNISNLNIAYLWHSSFTTWNTSLDVCLYSGFNFSHSDLPFPTRCCILYVRSGLYQLVIHVKGFRVCALHCELAITSITAIFVKPQPWPTPSESIAIYCVRKLVSCITHLQSYAKVDIWNKKKKLKNYALLLRSNLKVTKIEDYQNLAQI